MKNDDKVKRLAGLGVLTALVIGLQLFSNYVPLGPLSINFGMIPAIVGAILYGPLAGFFLGLVNGALTIFAPSTIELFMPYSAIFTIILCLTKTSVAGFVCGICYKLFYKRNEKASIIASSLVYPILNTTLFAIGALLFFTPILEKYIDGSLTNIYAVLFLAFIGWNFFVEFGVIVLLSAAIVYIVKIVNSKRPVPLIEENEENIEDN